MPRSEGPGKLWWVLATALAVRLLLVAIWTPPLAGDAYDYDRLATGLAAGEGYVDEAGRPTSWRPPLYPAFLAAVYALGGSAETIPWIQAFLDTASVALVALLARRALGRRAALAAGALAAIGFSQVAASAHVMSETFFALLLLAATLASVEVVDPGVAPSSTRRRILLALGAGGLLGLATLARGVLILFPPLLASAIVLSDARRSEPRAEAAAAGATRWSRPRASSLVSAACVMLGFLAVLAPWALRNLDVHGRLVPLATQSGITLYASYFPPEDRIFGMLPRDAVTEASEALPEAEADAMLTRETVARVLDDPGRLPRLTLLKVLYFWVPLDWEILPFYGALNATYVLTLGLIAAWLALPGRRRAADTPGYGDAGDSGAGPLWPLWLPVVYLFAMALLFYGSPRMRLPAEPFLAIFAGGGFVTVERRVGRPRMAWLMGGTAVALAALTLAIEPMKDVAARILSAGGIW